MRALLAGAASLERDCRDQVHRGRERAQGIRHRSVLEASRQLVGRARARRDGEDDVEAGEQARRPRAHPHVRPSRMLMTESAPEASAKVAASQAPGRRARVTPTHRHREHGEHQVRGKGNGLCGPAARGYACDGDQGVERGCHPEHDGSAGMGAAEAATEHRGDEREQHQPGRIQRDRARERLAHAGAGEPRALRRRFRRRLPLRMSQVITPVTASTTGPGRAPARWPATQPFMNVPACSG